MNYFFEALLNQQLDDIVVGGYLENDGIAKFTPMYRRLYFIFNDRTFEIQANLYLEFKEIEKIEPYFEVDDEDSFCISSIYTQCIKTEDPVKVESIEYYFENNNEDKVMFFEINYYIGSNRGTVFFNPKNIFGILYSHDKSEKSTWLSEMIDLGICVDKKLLP